MLLFILKYRQQLLYVAIGVLLLAGLLWAKEILLGALAAIAMLFSSKPTREEKIDRDIKAQEDAFADVRKQDDAAHTAGDEAGKRKAEEIKQWLNGDWK